MQVKSLTVTNLKSIRSAQLELAQVTLLVGNNNTGKSALVRALHVMQQGGELTGQEMRRGAVSGSIKIGLSDVTAGIFPSAPNNLGDVVLTANINGGRTVDVGRGAPESATQINNIEPVNFIYPYLSHRKVAVYEEQIDEQRSREVRTNLSNLAPKVDRLMDVHHLRHDEFQELVQSVIGLPLSAIASGMGKQVGMWVSGTEWIPLTAMGDGVGQMLGLIVQLVLAKDKLFLIEELENDMHPEALKALLSVIQSRSNNNQFVLSTHSNIVVRYLGALPDTKIYSVESSIETEGDFKLPTATVCLVGNDVSSRTRLLASMGYELADFDLFDGWLILEESSAERIIRDHLVRWFAPALSRVRTVAAQGVGDLDRTFNALEKLVLYTHLQERYRGRLLVIADGDEAGRDAVQRLASKYTEWPDAFITFSADDFEAYYPATFSARTAEVLATTGKQARREAKRQLLVEVLAYIETDDSIAKAAFAESAAEVIELLKGFSAKLGPASDQVDQGTAS